MENAYDNSAGVFTLPLGLVKLGGPLYIKKGWENFTLQGHPQGTVLQALPTFVAATDDCLIGIAIESTNDVNDLWNVTAANRRTALPMVEGSTVIEFWSGQDPLTSGSYWGLADQDTIPQYDEDLDDWQQTVYRAEMIQVISYNEDLRRAVLAQPVTRSFDQSAQLIPMNRFTEDVRMCKNITIRNLTLNGLQVPEDDPDPPVYLPYGIYSEFCWGLTVDEVETRYFSDSHIRSDVGVDVRISNVDVVGDYAIPEKTLRGLDFFWSRTIEVSNITADGVRHGIEFSQCNSHFSVDGYTATNSLDDGSLDCHGARNQHGVLRNFQVDKSCKIGNTSFPAGDQDIRVLHGTCGVALRVQGGSQVEVDNLGARYLLLQTIAGFPKYYPHDCTYSNCAFVNDSGSDSNNCLTLDCFEESGGAAFRQATNQRFLGCSFDQRRTAGGNFVLFFEEISDSTDLLFENCALTSEDSNPLAVNKSQVASRLQLGFNGCNLESNGGAVAAIHFETGSVGGLSLINSTFITSETSPDFYVITHPSIVSLDANDGNQVNP